MKNKPTKKSRTKFIPVDLVKEHSIYIPRLKAKTPNQQRYIDCINDNKITFCSGVAGTGKTKIAMSMAVEAILDGKYERILITRPAVQAAGEDLGHLPGDLHSKMSPYLMPLMDELSFYLTDTEIKGWQESGKIVVAPIAYMRGRNFHKSFIISDESQNLIYKQLLMLVTRIGESSKMVINGDPTQCDLREHHAGAFTHFMDRLHGIPNLGVVHLTKEDIVREKIVQDIIDRLELDN
jgi:phosphate starvation-inducible PhoH-like protein